MKFARHISPRYKQGATKVLYLGNYIPSLRLLHSFNGHVCNLHISPSPKGNQLQLATGHASLTSTWTSINRYPVGI